MDFRWNAVKFVPLEERHWTWINERNELTLMANTKGLAAESDSGDILGVCVCDSWTHTAVQLHIAIDNPIVLKNGRFQKEVFGYVFVQAGRSIAYGQVPADNEKALRFDKKLGFEEVIRLKNAWADGVDTVVLELRKENCRWIDNEEFRSGRTADVREQSASHDVSTASAEVRRAAA